MIYFFQFKYVGKGVGISWEITARYLENKKEILVQIMRVKGNTQKIMLIKHFF